MGVCNSQNKNDNEEVVPNNYINQSKKKQNGNEDNLNNQKIIKANIRDDKKKMSKSENINLKTSKLSVNIMNNNKDSNLYKINFEASIGETELPIFVNENEKIKIIIENSEEKTWSFLNDELTNYNGYSNYIYKRYNLGCLFCRISSSKIKHEINSNKFIFKTESPGPHLRTGETARGTQVSIDDTVLFTERLVNDTFYTSVFRHWIETTPPIAEMRPPRAADEACLAVEELSIDAITLVDDDTFPFP